jgi:hypothetical protein
VLASVATVALLIGAPALADRTAAVLATRVNA